MSDTCGVCNRPLSDDESRAAGIGPTCAKKFSGGHGTAGSHQLTFEEHDMTDPKPTGRCGNGPRTVLSPGDKAVVDEFKEYLAEKARADRAEAAIKRTVDAMRAYVVASGSAGVNPKQVIGLLSPTWPDGDHEAEASAGAEATP